MKVADKEPVQPISRLFADERNALNDDGFDRYVLMAALATCLHAADLIQNVFAIGDFAKHGVTPTLDVLSSVVEKIIVLHVDKKLCGGGMRVLSSCHSDGATVVSQPIISFVFHWRFGVLLFHVGGKSATLNHKVVDDAVKNSAVIEAVCYVREEVINGLRRVVPIELERHGPDGGRHQYLCCWHGNLR